MTAIGILLALGLSGCLDDTDGPSNDCLCTAVFVQVAISVVDSQDQPVSDLDLEVTFVRTGEVLDPDLLGSDPISGRYAIFNDSFLNRIAWQNQGRGEELRVVGRSSEGGFSQTYRVGVTDECRCHVRKVSGPDSVLVE